MLQTHKLGWLPDIPDARDISYRARYTVPRKLAARADLRVGCSPCLLYTSDAADE